MVKYTYLPTYLSRFTYFQKKKRLKFFFMYGKGEIEFYLRVLSSHDNRKVQVQLTIFFKTKTLGLFHAKYHNCCTFRQNVWVGDVDLGADY